MVDPKENPENQSDAQASSKPLAAGGIPAGEKGGAAHREIARLIAPTKDDRARPQPGAGNAGRPMTAGGVLPTTPKGHVAGLTKDPDPTRKDEPDTGR